MKFLLVLLLVLVGAWMWRSGRQARAIRKKPAPKSAPQDMVSCAHCGVHIPHAELVQGRDGVYCCQDHRLQSEG